MADRDVKLGRLLRAAATMPATSTEIQVSVSMPAPLAVAMWEAVELLASLTTSHERTPERAELFVEPLPVLYPKQKAHRQVTPLLDDLLREVRGGKGGK